MFLVSYSDLYGLLGDNGSHPPIGFANANPLWFNGPNGINLAPYQGAGKYLNSQAISAYSWSSVGDSNYNAFQVSLRKQMSNGVQFDINYTYSKSLDYTSAAVQVGRLQRAEPGSLQRPGSRNRSHLAQSVAE